MFMKMALLKLILALCFFQPFSGVFSLTDCRCTPKDDCWPSDHDWNGFNSTLNGRLIRTHPPSSVCYTSQPDYNPDTCSYILTQWSNSSYHGQDPASISFPFWANNSCLPIFPNGTSLSGDPGAGAKGCSLGKYPSYVVNATGPGDIAATIQWAKQRNIRLNVKNTGHSHLGRSTAYGSLSIWTHNIRGIQYHENFRSTSCPSNSSTPQMAATIAAGEVGMDIYREMAKHNAVVSAGANPSVGVVGWFTGGGHGFLSATYGMGSDNVLEATIVTMDGRILTINQCNHSELFYAVRGGGGGTYGVITSVVMKAYPSPQTTSWNLQVTLLDSDREKEWWDLVVYFHSTLAKLKAGGMQGYYFIFGPPVTATLSLGAAFMLFDKPNGTGEALVAPLVQRLETMAGIVGYESNFVAAPDFLTAYKPGNVNEPVAAGGVTLGSRLLPAEALEDVEVLAKMFRDIGPTLKPADTIRVPLILGHMIANSDNAGLETALNPAWRKTVTHFILASGWRDGASDEVIRAVRDDMTFNKTSRLRQLAPDSGAYFNEMDAFEEDWQYAAFGKNYPRLSAIKRNYDPDGMLWCRHCVGSEAWVEEEDGRLCRPEWWKRLEEEQV